MVFGICNQHAIHFIRIKKKNSYSNFRSALGSPYTWAMQEAFSRHFIKR